MNLIFMENLSPMLFFKGLLLGSGPYMLVPKIFAPTLAEVHYSEAPSIREVLGSSPNFEIHQMIRHIYVYMLIV